MADRRVALVTGASSGIGRAVARRLLDDGLTVLAAARRVDRMDDLRSAGAHTFALDVTDADSVARIVETAAPHGGVDVLVNNAGFGLYGAVEDVPLDRARHQFEVNLFGLAAVTRAVLPGMRARVQAGGVGRIVNIASMVGRVPIPLGAWYVASKHAVEGFSDCLRLELRGFGIDVVIVEPGVIQTEFGAIAGKPLRELSGDGAYAGLAGRVADAMDSAYGDDGGSPPELIAGVVSRAVAARRPKLRYVAGKGARLALTGRRILGDRLFDRLILAAMR